MYSSQFLEYKYSISYLSNFSFLFRVLRIPTRRGYSCGSSAWWKGHKSWHLSAHWTMGWQTPIKNNNRAKVAQKLYSSSEWVGIFHKSSKRNRQSRQVTLGTTQMSSLWPIIYIHTILKYFRVFFIFQVISLNPFLCYVNSYAPIKQECYSWLDSDSGKFYTLIIKCLKQHYISRVSLHELLMSSCYRHSWLYVNESWKTQHTDPQWKTRLLSR